VRINKNAGTSTCHILEQNYAPGSFVNVILQGRRGVDGRAKTVDGFDEDVYQLVNEVQSRLGTLACVAANLPYGLHKIIDRHVSYFTLLREPVSRCISYWYFAYQHRNEVGLWSTLERYQFDIRRLREARAAYQLTNDQVRMVSGSSAPEPSEQEFQLACENIEERFAFAGAVELFEPCLQRLRYHFGWAHVSNERLNARWIDDQSILPTAAEKHFRETNEWDIRLYEWLITKYLPRKLAP
jgi:hypothetical protein